MVKVRKRKRETASALEMANLLDVHPTTVVGWVDRGCPVVSKERVGRKTRWVFDIAVVKEWRKGDLARREKPRADFNEPMSLQKDLMSKKEEAQFSRIIEGLMSPGDE